MDWFPWGDEAFTKARTEDKPIFLSIGYSTCYWCHVMEREVFEDETIAELMNRLVVSIKVDREERPDIDRVYMAALQAMTGSGGWPMSMFLTPGRKPFFGATYIPPAQKFGRPGFPDILNRIHEVWATQRKEINESGEQIQEHIRTFLDPKTTAGQVDQSVLKAAFDAFVRSFDKENGGFGGAPKFPTPVSLNFLMRYSHRTKEKHGGEMVLATLRKMYDGGIYDHVGGGFHRYSTDARWHVPHFEKMLYDQAQLVIAYVEAFQETREEFYADVARDILQYVQKEMTDKSGAFFSAQDAESALNSEEPNNKKEGAFYTWRKEEIDHLLSPDEANVICPLFDMRPEGNVIEDAHGEFSGLNVLHRVRSVVDAASSVGVSEQEALSLVASARLKLADARRKRVPPHLDDKILASWNGLMISAFARASQILDDGQYLHAAVRAAEFVLENMMVEKGMLLRRFRDGEARFEAGLEDYAFMCQAFIDLYEASFDARWLGRALEFAEKKRSLFYDTQYGGFYDTSGGDTSVFLRTKESSDGAEPSGNSIAILNFLRLSQMTDNREYARIAEQSLQYFGNRMQAVPHGMAQFLVSLDFSIVKPKQIVVCGDPKNDDTRALIREVHSHFIPDKILLLVDDNFGLDLLSSYLPFLKGLRQVDGRATAYICENYTCLAPTNDVLALRSQITS